MHEVIDWKAFDEEMNADVLLSYVLRFSTSKENLLDARRYTNNHLYILNDDSVKDIIDGFVEFYNDNKKGIIRLSNGWIKFVRTPKLIAISWIDPKGNHVEKYDDWNKIWEIMKEEIARKYLPGDVEYKENDEFYEMMMKIIKRIPTFDPEEFKATHNYRDRCELLREQLAVGNIYNPLRDGIGIYQLCTNDKFFIECKYKDSKRDSYIKVWYYDLENYLYDKYEMHDVIGRETYTEKEILQEQINRWLNRPPELASEFAGKFQAANAKDRLDLVKDYCGAKSYSGYGSPLHKHEYGLHRGDFNPSRCCISWKDINGDHTSEFKWKEVVDMFDVVLNE